MNKHPQMVTLWRYEGVDLNNVPSYYNVGTFNVRWEDRSELIVNNDGKQSMGRATIYFPEKVFEIGDYIVLGDIPDINPPSNAYEIKNERSISNLSGTRYEYRALV